MPAIPPHGRWRQKDQPYKVILSYTVSSQPGLHEPLSKDTVSRVGRGEGRSGRSVVGRKSKGADTAWGQGRRSAINTCPRLSLWLSHRVLWNSALGLSELPLLCLKIKTVGLKLFKIIFMAGIG